MDIGRVGRKEVLIAKRCFNVLGIADPGAAGIESANDGERDVGGS